MEANHKIALITGITGQDGAYLAEFLLKTMEEKGIIGPPVANSQVREVLDYGQTIPPKEE